MLPKDIGFQGLRIDAPDIICITETGEFLIDSLSGGMLATIEMVALVFARSLAADATGNRFVVTMDEPENHLHPAMQRTLLTSSVNAFPQVQFIVATHSPYIVASSLNSNVYALRYEEVSVIDDGREAPNRPLASKERRVTCVRVSSKNSLLNPPDVVREVLGVPVTMPMWAENELGLLTEKYKSVPFDAETLEALRTDMEVAGLESLFPDAALRLAREND